MVALAANDERAIEQDLQARFQRSSQRRRSREAVSATAPTFVAYVMGGFYTVSQHGHLATVGLIWSPLHSLLALGFGGVPVWAPLVT